MPDCPQCGASCEVEDRYCPQCGRRVASADAASTAATRKAMDVTDVQYKLGMVYFRKGDYLRAAETWTKVLKTRPGNEELKALIQDARSRHKASEAQP